MTKQDKLIASLILAHCVFGSFWVYWVAPQIGSPPSFVLPNLVLIGIGIAAAIGWFKRLRWAILLSVVFYFVQVFHLITPKVQWSFSLGFHLNIGFGWFGQGAAALNLVALFMLVWSTYRAFAPNNSFKPSPLRGLGQNPPSSGGPA